MTVPNGSLPVYSVNTAEEAEELIVDCCPLHYSGEFYYARELAEEQTLDNLLRFADRLAVAAERRGIGPGPPEGE